MYKLAFGDVVIYEDDDYNNIFTRDGSIFRHKDESMIGVPFVDDSATAWFINLYNSTKGDDTPLLLKTAFSNIIIRFENWSIKDIKMRARYTIEPCGITREQFWVNYLGKPYPYTVHYNGPKILDINSIPSTKDIVSGYPRIDDGFDPHGDFNTWTREVQITDKYVFKKGNSSQSRTELFYSLWSQNPFFVPVISAFYHEEELVIVQPRIYGTLNPDTHFMPLFNNLLGDEFSWMIPRVGIVFFDGVALYAGSQQIIVDDSGIPWIFDLGELLMRNTGNDLVPFDSVNNNWPDYYKKVR